MSIFQLNELKKILKELKEEKISQEAASLRVRLIK